MIKINISKQFSPQLRNRDERQGDGTNTAVQFRRKFLSCLVKDERWQPGAEDLELDFSGVEIIGPSFANEAFAFFTKYSTPEDIYTKIKFANINPIDKEIIDWEITNGYHG